MNNEKDLYVYVVEGEDVALMRLTDTEAHTIACFLENFGDDRNIFQRVYDDEVFEIF